MNAPIETTNYFEQTKDVESGSESRSKRAAKARKASPKIEKPAATLAAAAAPAPVTSAAAAVAVEPQQHHNNELYKIEPSVTPKDSPKHGAAKADKATAKKKRNENTNLLQQQQQQQLLLLGSGAAGGGVRADDDVNVNNVMHLLGRAELSRSEIQIIIDYLLNKQQDTLVDHSDWSDDPLQKLKKQLLEREQALAEEQEATVGLQAKLREMRTTINTLSAENRARGADVERLAAERQTEVQLLVNENKSVRERLDQDNQRLSTLAARLQEELHKLQQQQAAGGADASAQLQQHEEANAQLQLEVVALRQTLQQHQLEAGQRAADADAKIHECQQLVQQREAELSQLFAKNAAYVGELQQQVNEHEARAKHLDDSSKVEIRNLQNALDSSNREVNVYAVEAAKWRQALDEQKGAVEADQSRQGMQQQELLATVAEVRAQLADREAALVQKAQAIAQQEATVEQLRAQLGAQASQTASAEQQLNATTEELKQRLGQETEKVGFVSHR